MLCQWPTLIGYFSAGERTSILSHHGGGEPGVVSLGFLAYTDTLPIRCCEVAMAIRQHFNRLHHRGPTHASI